MLPVSKLDSLANIPLWIQIVNADINPVKKGLKLKEFFKRVNKIDGNERRSFIC